MCLVRRAAAKSGKIEAIVDGNGDLDFDNCGFGALPTAIAPIMRDMTARNHLAEFGLVLDDR